MSIDSGLKLTYRPNYPVPGINQSSQPFRDNFQIIQKAIENLQSATHAFDSAITLSAAVDPLTAEVKYSLGFPDDVLRIPSGSPTNPSAGMLRYTNNKLSYYNGVGWASIMTTGEFGGQLEISRDPLSDLEIVSKGYLDRRLAGFTPNTTSLTAESIDNALQEGVFLSYDRENRRLTTTVQDFNIVLTGAVTGVGRVTKLNDVTISTTLGANSGITVQDESVTLGTQGGISTLNFVGNGVTVARTGRVAIVTIPNSLSRDDVRDTVGTFIQGSFRDPNLEVPTDTGITVNFDRANNTMYLGVKDFTINLTGAVTGQTLISKLGNATIHTSTDLIKGLTISRFGVPTGLVQSVKGINFVGAGFTVDQSGEVATISLADGLTLENVRDEMGRVISGTFFDPNQNTSSETGIIVNYDAVNGQLQLAPREFNVTLAGAVSGTAKVTRLQDITINTTAPNLLTGLSLRSNSNLVGPDSSVKTLNFTGAGVNVSQSGGTATINIPIPLSTSDVRYVIGNTLSGTAHGDGQTKTQSGITVNFDPDNNLVELGVREFSINLSGAVTGSAVVTKLQDVTINTSSRAIEGIAMLQDGIPISRGDTVKSVDIRGGTVSVADERATITIVPEVNADTVRSTVIDLSQGSQNGLAITYDSANRKLRYALNPISITLTGAITGQGTINFSGTANDGKVVILTTGTGGGGGGGLQVADEYGTVGESVQSINFVGGGVTSSVSVDGQVATVYIPNSPAGERFLLLDKGSDNVPNARRLRAGAGIVLVDGGPGEDLVISADSDSVLARSQILLDGIFVGARSTINIKRSRHIMPRISDDPQTDQIVLEFFTYADGWYRRPKTDFGTLADRYGNMLDNGSIHTGMIDIQADLGLLFEEIEPVSSGFDFGEPMNSQYIALL